MHEREWGYYSPAEMWIMNGNITELGSPECVLGSVVFSFQQKSYLGIRLSGEEVLFLDEHFV